ncbi:Protein yciF [Fimbriiglobus ruber]|uniref:Protein yciF n=1 Tax=Fimbriiglobus ruber TaxID=1908690 RepID=A0A225DE72_9BACT|nr:Protein yciF [Fimbriiglobus ruber]
MGEADKKLTELAETVINVKAEDDGDDDDDEDEEDTEKDEEAAPPKSVAKNGEATKNGAIKPKPTGKKTRVANTPGL